METIALRSCWDASTLSTDSQWQKVGVSSLCAWSYPLTWKTYGRVSFKHHLCDNDVRFLALRLNGTCVLANSKTRKLGQASHWQVWSILNSGKWSYEQFKIPRFRGWFGNLSRTYKSVSLLHVCYYQQSSKPRTTKVPLRDLIVIWHSRRHVTVLLSATTKLS
jgi:hypothetical protein